MQLSRRSTSNMFSLTALLISTVSAVGQANGAKEVFKKASPAIMVIMALDDNDQPMSLGTGFYIKSDLVATNLHVVRKAKKLRVFGALDQKERRIKGIHAVSTDHDIAVLSMEDVGEPLICATSVLEAGDPVFAIGNPRGLEATLSTGIVSGIRKQDKTSLYQITAPISPGSSGGPVLNDKAQVVGIASSYIDAGQNLNFAVDVKHLAEAIASNPSGEARNIDTVSEGTTRSEQRKATVESVRVVSPEFSAEADKLIWNLSIKNEGDKAVKNVDLLILVIDGDNKELIHFVRRRVDLSVPPKLAKRAYLAEKVNFFTSKSLQWHCEYRILNFDYDE